ncbi:hypothetical protein ATCC90586_003560 [Pythium insidiosum]|nr:hypothetical protein ATCC90586_003560 [Pythium insidiosum]
METMTVKFEELEKRDARIEQQHQNGLEKLQDMINGIPKATAAQLEDGGVTLVALADLKSEIQFNKIAYTQTELKVMKDLFIAGRESYIIPRDKLDLPVWYISRSDLRFDSANPFASGQYHSLHYGTLSSGASVAINVVNATVDDDASRSRFVEEVNTLNLLRDPHILPFYGANHVGSPMLYVTAHAKHGDFVSYLRTHPDEYFRLFLDAARGLMYLHKNKVVHGNLKCANLLVMADGTGVVSDFMFAFLTEVIRILEVMAAQEQVTREAARLSQSLANVSLVP